MYVSSVATASSHYRQLPPTPMLPSHVWQQYNGSNVAHCWQQRQHDCSRRILTSVCWHFSGEVGSFALWKLLVQCLDSRSGSRGLQSSLLAWQQTYSLFTCWNHRYTMELAARKLYNTTTTGACCCCCYVLRTQCHIFPGCAHCKIFSNSIKLLIRKENILESI